MSCINLTGVLDVEKVKVKIKRNTVQETIMPQLYAKCCAMKKWPGLFFDNDCRRIKSMIDYDFSRLALGFSPFAVEMGALSAACRQFAFAAEIRGYLKERPRAKVINLGCGLDTIGRQADNGVCGFINIDLPDVIDLREKVINRNERERDISADVRAESWFDDIAYDKNDGAVFIASGMFLYWDRGDVKKFLRDMSERFEGARLVFDAQNKKGAVSAQRALLKAGIHAKVKFYLDSPEKELKEWDMRYKKISCKKMVSDYRKLDKRFSFAARSIVWISEKNNMAQMNVIDF